MIAAEKLNNIHKLKPDEVLQIFHECEEYLGVVDMEEASMALCISKRRVYQKMNPNNSIIIGNHKFICINLVK